MDSNTNNYATGSLLGEGSEYNQDYDSALLYPILRADYRDTVENFVAASYGHDLWQCYEVSWLNHLGVPQVACADIIVPIESPAIVESKSLKLYLNSFHNRPFTDQAELKLVIETDLSALLGAAINVVFRSASVSVIAQPTLSEAALLDDLAVECRQYQRDAKLLLLDADAVDSDKRHVSNEQLCSHLLRSHCPVTNQPDWGTLTIRYSGAAINRESLLRYIVSFRQHNGFHEQCVEQIYADIMSECRPELLTVCAQYTRRGGIDINPLRSNHNQPLNLNRVWRQ